MIDVPQYRTEIAALPGTHILLPREQINELLTETERGQKATRTLNRIRTIAALAASAAGIRA